MRFVGPRHGPANDILGNQVSHGQFDGAGLSGEGSFLLISPPDYRCRAGRTPA
jgi:hypothetical protein